MRRGENMQFQSPILIRFVFRQSLQIVPKWWCSKAKSLLFPSVKESFLYIKTFN